MGYIGVIAFHGDNREMAKQTLKLTSMALAELVQLRDEVQSALNGKIEMERQELRAKLAEIESLQSGTKSKGGGNGRLAQNARKHPAKGKMAAAKYRGPNGETWAGRGLTPKWLVELEGKGKKREQYLIKA
jgi:DNA-binding protein H-NS